MNSRSRAMWPAASPVQPVGAPLLRFDRVTRHKRDGEHQITVLDRVSFAVHDKAFVGLFGMRRTGKSTLLRLAAGIELPDEGSVSLNGRSLSHMSCAQRQQLLGGSIALLSAHAWHPPAEEPLIDHVASALAAEERPTAAARRAARQALGRVGMLDAADRPTVALSAAERLRALIALAMVRRPRLLLVDEPALIPSLRERDETGALLRAVAAELNATLIVASEELAALQGATVLMSIAAGELCSTEEGPLEPPEPPEPPGAQPGAVVTLLRGRRQAGAGALPSR